MTAGLLSASSILAAPRPSTTPIEGLRDASPRVHALVNARLVLAPGRVIEKGGLVVRDGVVSAVGADVTAPADARVWDLAGATVYAGFIESHASAFLPAGWKSAPRGRGAVAPGDFESRESGAPESGGARAWNPRLTPERSVASALVADPSAADGLRSLGFTVAHVVPGRGLLRGQSALVSLSGATFNTSLVRPAVAQKVHFEFGQQPGSGARYPTSLMGSIALLRQTLLDAQWHLDAHAAYERHAAAGAERPEFNESLASLAPVLRGEHLVLADATDELDIERAQRIAREFKLRLAIVGNGTEYRVLPALVAARTPVVLPLAFPEPPDVDTIEKAADVSLDQLQHWELAPSNPGRLAAAGVPVALTSSGLARAENEFWGRVRDAVKAGWSADQALAALTTMPAELFGISATHGTLEQGKVANMVVARGDLFAGEDTEIELVFVDGEPFEQASWGRFDARGTWSIEWSGVAGPGEIIIRGARPNRLAAKVGDQNIDLTANKEGLVVLAPAALFGAAEGVVRLSARGDGDTLRGAGELPDGRSLQWTARRTGPAPPDQEPEGRPKPDDAPKKPIATSSAYPAGAFGRTEPPPQPEWVLVKNATLWTSGRAGVLPNADLLVRAGRIVDAGPNLSAPDGAVVIDGTGRHVTPGFVDCHSHIAIQRGVNETGSSVTVEVRIADVIDPTDINIYRQLCGGVTTSHLLHGSANSMGGQDAVIKLRWGRSAEGLPIEGAPDGVKFALGENPVRANAAGFTGGPTRFPMSRMGVRETILDMFKRAGDYERAWSEHRAGRSLVPPRRDLRLEATTEIARGARRIHIHSYRQDEVLMFVRLAQELKLPVATFQHILEGYKVAPEIAQLGAGASSFADWWAYKYEVIDAIPHNGAMLHRAGVITSFNSDNAEMARRLNTEAAKAVKYGGLTPEEALKFVTLNPAIQLGLGDRLGSLEAGKDADFVVWDAPPLSSFAKPEQTWVDGRRYFDRAEDAAVRTANAAERAALIQRALAHRQRPSGPPGSGRPGKQRPDEGPPNPPPPNPPPPNWFAEWVDHQSNEFRAIYHHGEEIHNCSTHAGGRP